ncbi:hypothetical protein ACCO45_006158 [Purpureocillium lilacinum]|uniref:Uncharacterized protein n=1 Tax=Purpureocillium lilacinum TaxID=33203 RepID=A0ACC4DXR0_PURLI
MAKSRALAAKQSREPSGGSRAVKCSDDGPIEAYYMNRVGGTDQTPTSRRRQVDRLLEPRSVPDGTGREFIWSGLPAGRRLAGDGALGRSFSAASVAGATDASVNGKRGCDGTFSEAVARAAERCGERCDARPQACIRRTRAATSSSTAAYGRAARGRESHPGAQYPAVRPGVASPPLGSVSQTGRIWWILRVAAAVVLMMAVVGVGTTRFGVSDAGTAPWHRGEPLARRLIGWVAFFGLGLRGRSDDQEAETCCGFDRSLPQTGDGDRDGQLPGTTYEGVRHQDRACPRLPRDLAGPEGRCRVAPAAEPSQTSDDSRDNGGRLSTIVTCSSSTPSPPTPNGLACLVLDSWLCPWPDRPRWRQLARPLAHPLARDKQDKFVAATSTQSIWRPPLATPRQRHGQGALINFRLSLGNADAPIAISIVICSAVRSERPSPRPAHRLSSLAP